MIAPVTWTVEFSREAARKLAKADAQTAKRIIGKIERWASFDDPAGAPEVGPLKGRRKQLRMRVADWRVIFEIDQGRVAIIVITIGHRREVYR